MITRAKFKCDLIEVAQESKQYKVQLSPVISGSVENKEFFKWTPSGSLTLFHVNENIKFEYGKEYYLDISEA